MHGKKVYFVVNRHINPSNVCAISCKFCAFGKPKGHSDAYEMSMEKILSLVSNELKEIHIVGGLHPDWKFEKYLEIVREVSKAAPDAHIKAFTAVEIDWFSQISGKSVSKVISDLMNAGVDALPGGGAEIFSPEVRKKSVLLKLLVIHGLKFIVKRINKVYPPMLLFYMDTLNPMMMLLIMSHV